MKMRINGKSFFGSNLEKEMKTGNKTLDKNLYRWFSGWFLGYYLVQIPTWLIFKFASNSNISRLWDFNWFQMINHFESGSCLVFQKFSTVRFPSTSPAVISDFDLISIDFDLTSKSRSNRMKLECSGSNRTKPIRLSSKYKPKIRDSINLLYIWLVVDQIRCKTP